MNKMALLAGVLWLALPLAPAAADDDYDDHARDHHQTLPLP